MTKLATLSLAAAAWIPAGLAAQTVQPPVAWQDVPPARLDVPAAPSAPVPTAAPAPGVTWQSGAAAPVMRAPMPAPQAAPMPSVRPPMVMQPARPPVIVRHDRDRIEHGRRFPHVRQVQRGFIVPPFWFGPQFHVQNWALYGFPAPAAGARWIRFYDDALLVDPYGRVVDTRGGLDWDRYGEPWGYERGIPEYVGDGDYYPDPEDHAYVEEQDDVGYAEGYDDYDPYGPPPPSYGAYGYGYPYWGGVTITETTVTTTTAGGHVTTTREVSPPYPPRRRHYRPLPPPGERG